MISFHYLGIEDIFDAATEGNSQNRQEEMNSDIPDESLDEDKGSNFSLGDKTKNYLDPEDDRAKTEPPTPLSPRRT